MPLYRNKENGELIHALDMVETDYGYVSEEFYKEFYLDDEMCDIEFYDLIEKN